MIPHLVPHYGPHVAGLILAGRPLAYRGLYAAGVRPSTLCAWFDPAAGAWLTVAAEADWNSSAAGGWHDWEADTEWTTDSAGGWRRRKPCG